MDMTSLLGPVLACSSVATGDVVSEPRAKRHRYAAVVASASIAFENVVVALDDCSASEYTLFGTPEATESGGSPVGSVCDEDASTHDEFDGPSSAVVQKVTMTSVREPASYWEDRNYPSPTQMWGGEEIAKCSIRALMLCRVLPWIQDMLARQMCFRHCVGSVAMEVIWKFHRRKLSNSFPWSIVSLRLLSQIPRRLCRM